MTSPAPYLSVVATARNDNHGGNLLGRMQLFVSGLLEQCRRHDLPAELVLVEWNPVPDQPRLAEALKWPTEGSPCGARVIEVPAEVHARYKYAKALPLYQMIAKNVGIRRARGEFVLATNIDILFSDELMRYLAERRLDPGRMYRIDRHDAAADVPAGAPITEQLEYCRTHVIRINGRNKTIYPNATVADRLRAYGRHLVTAPRLKGVPWKGDGWGARCLDLAVLPPRVAWNHVNHWMIRPFLYAQLHLNACGDFTLLSRQKWFELHGYPELDIFSMHLDSVLCHAAHHSGAEEFILPEPMRIYHIEHGLGSGWTPEGQARLNARLAAAGIEQLDFDQFLAWARKMKRERRPMIFADDNWGLARDELPETVLSTGDVGARTTVPAP
jgi:hypothetical protein